MMFGLLWPRWGQVGKESRSTTNRSIIWSGPATKRLGSYHATLDQEKKEEEGVVELESKRQSKVRQQVGDVGGVCFALLCFAGWGTRIGEIIFHVLFDRNSTYLF